MNEEEKKAINDLKRTVERYEAKPIDKISVEFDEFDYKIVKIVLNLIKKLQKKNEELCKLITEGIEIKINSPYENYFLEFMKENFIPIQNIKEKIKELNKLLKEYEENNMEKDEDYFFDVNAINGEIQVLQELLENKN